MTTQQNMVLKERSKRRCAIDGCDNVPEPKDRTCIACQLEGKVARRRPSTPRG